MSKERKQAGCQGVVYFIGALSFLAIYINLGIDAYVYANTGVLAFAGILMLLSAALID